MWSLSPEPLKTYHSVADVSGKVKKTSNDIATSLKMCDSTMKSQCFLGLFALGAPRDPPYNIAFRCGRPSRSQTRVPFSGQVSPWLGVGIWPGCPRGASSLTPSYADRSFPGQSPLCPDFGIWPGFPRGAFSITDSRADRPFPG